jgi:hypothetical protein
MAMLLIHNIDALNLNSSLDKANPAKEPITIEANTVKVVMIKLLNKYRDIGIPVDEVTANKSIKLSAVGFCTKKRGGHSKSSTNGLNAWLKIYTIGKPMKMATGIKMIKNRHWEMWKCFGFIRVPK